MRYSFCKNILITCPFIPASNKPIVWSTKDQAWHVYSFNSVKSILKSPDFVANYLDHLSDQDRQSFLKDHELLRQDTIKLLKTKKADFDKTINSTIEDFCCLFFTKKNNDVAVDLILPLCKVLANLLTGIDATLADNHNLHELSIDIFNMTNDSDEAKEKGNNATQKFAEFLHGNLHNINSGLHYDLSSAQQNNETLRNYAPSFIIQMYVALVSSLPLLLANAVVEVTENSTTRNFTGGKNTLSELLRLNGPSICISRKCARETELHGFKVRKNDHLMLFLATANRDNSKYSNSHAIELNRKNVPALSFGAGIHACIGANIVRSILGSFVSQFLEYDHGFKLKVSELKVGGSDRIKGYTVLPIEWSSVSKVKF